MTSPHVSRLRMVVVAAGAAALAAAAAIPPGVQPAVPNTAVVAAPRDDGWWRSRHEALVARAAEAASQGRGRIVFIGDSITQGWEEAGKRVWDQRYAGRGGVNMGISGDRTQHVLWRLEHGALDAMAQGEGPELVVVLIGTNNSTAEAGNTAEQIGAGIVAVVGKVREKLPRARVLVLGILPRGEGPGPQREKNAAASRIAAAAADGEMVHYLDLGPLFMDEKGTISREVMPDLLHLSEKGYEIWAEGMEAKVRELLGER